MTKVQLSLTTEEAEILAGYGSQFGYSLPKTIRYFLSKASESIVRDGNMPTYHLSEKTEQVGLDALQEHKEGKTHQIEDVDEFVNSL